MPFLGEASAGAGVTPAVVHQPQPHGGQGAGAQVPHLGDTVRPAGAGAGLFTLGGSIGPELAQQIGVACQGQTVPV